MNLAGQNIGQNYKGILNLDATTINTPLDATLRAVTDGMGTSSILSLSTAAVAIGSGTITSNGVATIKGAGSNILSLRDSTDIEKASFDNNGTLAIGSGTQILSGNMVFSSNNYFIWNSRGIQSWSADGVMLLRDNAQTSFGRLQLGGTTSSFPAIKRNAAAIDFKLADDSAYAQINTGNIKIGADNASQYIYASTGGGTVSAGFYLQSSTNKVSIYTSGSERVSIDSLGVASFTPAAIALSAGATNPKEISLAYTINNPGAQTGTATGIFLNATETALNGMTHNLMDLQVGGTSKLRVDNSGNTTITQGSSLILNSGYRLKIFSSGMHNMTFQGGGGSGAYFDFLGNDGSIPYATFRQTSLDLTSITTIKIGGTTSSFPAIKRNGAAIDFRLADDSGYANITAGNIVSSGGYIYSQANGGRFGNVGISYGPFGLNAKEIAVSGDNLSLCATTGTGVSIGTLTLSASAILQADSTTRGFLPPRQTQAQRTAIALSLIHI